MLKNRASGQGPRSWAPTLYGLAAVIGATATLVTAILSGCGPS